MKIKNRGAAPMMLSAMAIFGTIGIFRRGILFPSGVVALVRGVIGVLFLAFVMLCGGKRPHFGAIRKNLIALLVSGAMLGFNWILLFEAYRYTTVATATLCYYMAPVLMILVSPFLFKERLTLRRVCCVAAALCGMVLVSGILTEGAGGASAYRGILLGLAAAVLYAAIVLTNKTMHGLDAYDRTVTQLGISSIVLLPYVLLTERVTAEMLTERSVILLIVVGVVHTGIAYALYFGSMERLRAQTVALFSYLDPVLAVLLSALLLKEKIGVSGIVGAVLVLGSALIAELPAQKAEE